MDEGCADQLAEPLADLDTLLVATITLTEVFKFTTRVRGARVAMRAPRGASHDTHTTFDSVKRW